MKRLVVLAATVLLFASLVPEDASAQRGRGIGVGGVRMGAMGGLGGARVGAIGRPMSGSDARPGGAHRSGSGSDSGPSPMGPVTDGDPYYGYYVNVCYRPYYASYYGYY